MNATFAQPQEPTCLPSAETIRRYFAENVRLRARQLNIPLNTVADCAGVSRSQFYNVLRGRSSPSLDWITKVAGVLELPPARLIQAPPPEESIFPSAPALAPVEHLPIPAPIRTNFAYMTPREAPVRPVHSASDWHVVPGAGPRQWNG